MLLGFAFPSADIATQCPLQGPLALPTIWHRVGVQTPAAAWGLGVRLLLAFLFRAEYLHLSKFPVTQFHTKDEHQNEEVGAKDE